MLILVVSNSAQIARKMPAIFIDELLEVLEAKISSPQQWDILANFIILKHNLKHNDIQCVGVNTYQYVPD